MKHIEINKQQTNIKPDVIASSAGLRLGIESERDPPLEQQDRGIIQVTQHKKQTRNESEIKQRVNAIPRVLLLID